MINKIIHDEIKYYILPVYSLDYIEKNTDDLNLTVDNDIFLELLLLRIRGETEKKTDKREKELTKDINFLESSISLQNSNMQLVMDKKEKLEKN